MVVGGGFIGLETAENLAEAGLSVTLVEKLPQVMPPLDGDMAVLLKTELEKHGVALRLGVGIAGFEGEENFTALLDDGSRLPCDMAVLALGVAPDTALAKEAGLELGIKGALVVNEKLQTSDPDIYAAGDAVHDVPTAPRAGWGWYPWQVPANPAGPPGGGQHLRPGRGLSRGQRRIHPEAV